MRRNSWVICLLVLFTACSSSGLSALDAAAEVATDAAADAGAEVGRDAAVVNDLSLGTVHGRVIFDKHNNQLNIPARHREIGFVDDSATATTDIDGNYNLGIPAQDGLVLRATLLGQISVQRVLVIPAGSVAVDLHVIDIDAYVGAVARVHGNFDTSYGVVAVRFAGSARGGYGATLSAAHGGAWVYSAPFSGNPVESASTFAAGDTVYFYAVVPGTTTLAVTAPAGLSTCGDGYAPGTVQYPVVAGTMTEIVLSCP